MTQVLRNIAGHLKTYRITQVKGFSTASDDVIFEEKNNSGIITLNRPKLLNALCVSMSKKLKAKLTDWENKKDLVIIKGAGEKAFCVGGDIREVFSRNSTDTFYTAYTVNAILARYKTPYVSIIDGINMGAGAGLSINSKHSIATERTLFAMPETAIGIVPDSTASKFLGRLQGKLGLFLGMTGTRLKGQDVVKAGLAKYYVKSQKLPELEDVLVRSNGKEIDQTIQRFSDLDKAPASFDEHLDLINTCFSGDTVEKIYANLKQHQDNPFAKDTLQTLQQMSPTSLKLTKKLLELGINLDVIECIKMELRVNTRAFEKGDFKEGIRAKIVDKDNDPKWKPKTLEEVTDAYIETFFEKLPEDREFKF